MGSKAGIGRYYQEADTGLTIPVEEQLFELGEYVSYYGVARIEKVEITKVRRAEGSTIKKDRDFWYYHVRNIDNDQRNQEFNGTLDKDRIANLLYR